MEPKKKEALIQSLWSAFLSFLQDIFVKKMLTMLVKNAAGGGLRVWLVKFLAEELFEEVGRPTANYILVELRYKLDVVEGKRLLVKLKEARNVEDYNSTVDDNLLLVVRQLMSET